MAEEEKTAITSSSIKKSLESKKYLKVLVIAQPQEKTKHLGDASEPGSWTPPLACCSYLICKNFVKHILVVI